MVYKLGNITADFSEYLKDLPRGIWQIRLDPYLHTSVSSEADVFFSSGKILFDQNMLNQSKMVRSLPFSIFFEHVHVLPDGSWLYTVNRRDTNEIVQQYYISSDYKNITLINQEYDDSGFSAFGCLNDIFAYTAIEYGMLTFHGVLMEDQGRGIILSAASGVGKSTHARLWRDSRNSLIINGDRSNCYKENGQWIGHGLPWSGTSGEQVNRKVPMKAFVQVCRGAENRVERLKGIAAFNAMYSQLKYPEWDRKRMTMLMDLLEDFSNEIPVLRLYCRPEVESVEVLNRAISEL